MSQRLQSGAVLRERYSVDQEIGRGGMAVVYRATDLRHDALVAIKVLHPDFASRVGAERFTREVQIAARLQHPNVVPVFDSGVHEGLPFYVMPYVEGETLEGRMAREGPLPIDEAVRIAGEVADALEEAHAQGFVHRDVKPGNILLSHGHAMLSDFGIARALEAVGSATLTEAGLVPGTAAYMSPEQALGQEVDGRSDLYSLCCVLYEMLTGGPPFTGSPQVLRARHSAEAAPGLRTARETIPAALERVVLKGLSKLPADRFADARSLRDALEHASRSTAPPRRTRPLVIAGALGLLAIVTAVWLARDRAGRDDALDVNRIIVFPLVVSADFAGGRTVGEDMATLIGSTLDGTGPLRWIDGWPLLQPGQREDVRNLPPDIMLRLARNRNCAFMVTGRLVARGDSTDVVLSLTDVRNDVVVSTANGRGGAAETWRATLQAVNTLLPKLIPDAAVELSAEWHGREPAAIARFLLGESSFRRLRLDSAWTHFKAAVEADPTFALAAIRGAIVASWNHQPAEAASLIGIALQQPVPPRYAGFARGLEAYLSGRADSAAAAFRQVVATDPEMVAAWMQLGETYAHLLPTAGNTDSLAEVAFERAHRLDPSAANLLFHLLEIRLRRGNLAAAEPLVPTFLASARDTDLTRKIELMLACVRDGPLAVDWSGLATTEALRLLTVAFAFAGGGAHPPCAEAGFSAVLEHDTAATNEAAARRWSALFGQHALLLARDQVEDARFAIDSAALKWGFGASLYLYDAPIGDAFVEPARDVARGDAREWGRSYARLPWNTRLWELGVFEAYHGDAAVANGVAAELERRARETGSDHERVLARSVATHVALAAGDSARAFAMLSELVPATSTGDVIKWDEAAPLGLERLAFARLLIERGELRRAIDILAVFDSPWPMAYLVFLPQSLQLRLAAAEQLGDVRAIDRFRRRIDALGRGEAMSVY